MVALKQRLKKFQINNIQKWAMLKNADQNITRYKCLSEKKVH